MICIEVCNKKLVIIVRARKTPGDARQVIERWEEVPTPSHTRVVSVTSSLGAPLKLRGFEEPTCLGFRSSCFEALGLQAEVFLECQAAKPLLQSFPVWSLICL